MFSTFTIFFGYLEGRTAPRVEPSPCSTRRASQERRGRERERCALQDRKRGLRSGSTKSFRGSHLVMMVVKCWSDGGFSWDFTNEKL